MPGLSPPFSSCKKIKTKLFTLTKFAFLVKEKIITILNDVIDNYRL